MAKIDISRSFINNMRQDRNLYKINEITRKSINIVDETIVNTNPLRYVFDKYRSSINIYDIKSGLLKEHNFIVAGGSLCRELIGERSGCDVDIFIIGGDNAENRVLSFLEAVKCDNIYLSNNCVTYLLQNTVYQIILKYYDSIVDVLNDFDLGSSMVAYDGIQLYTNAEGKFTYETQYNVFNSQKIRHSYRRRISKYRDMQFGFLHTNIRQGGSFEICPQDEHMSYEASSAHLNSTSAYDPFDMYENPAPIMIKTIKNIVKGNPYMCTLTQIDELKTSKVAIKIHDDFYNYFGQDVDLLIKYMKILFTNYEIKEILGQYIDNKKAITIAARIRVNELIRGKYLTFNVKNGNIHKLSEPDNVDLTEFCGPDYVDYSDIKIALK